jgi:glycerate kinase
MRALFASDAIGPLRSAAAGAVLASGWTGSDVRVLPLGTSAAGFIDAYADLLGVTVEQAMAGEMLITTAHSGDVAVVHVSGPEFGPGIPYAATSWPIGEAIAAVLRDGRPEHLVVDLGGLAVHDGGAGLLAALGANADQPLDQGVHGLMGLSRFDLAAVRAALGGTELIGVVPADQLTQPLLGLRGITSLSRDAGRPELMLSTDAALAGYARLAHPDQPDAPGAGACGGLGFAVLALGGRLTTGPALALASPAGVAATRGVELVVTGCTVFDFATRGGGVVAAAAAKAVEVLSPCIVIAGEVVIGSREMRTMGIEAAYAVRESSLDTPSGAVTGLELAQTARRVARSWNW